MLAQDKLSRNDGSKDHRAALGAWLRDLREAQGMSQKQLASVLELDYYTFISQLENGRGKIPSSRYVDWAKALGQEPQDFVRELLRHYDPITYAILFPADGAQ